MKCIWSASWSTGEGGEGWGVYLEGQTENLTCDEDNDDDNGVMVMMVLIDVVLLMVVVVVV